MVEVDMSSNSWLLICGFAIACLLGDYETSGPHRWRDELLAPIDSLDSSTIRYPCEPILQKRPWKVISTLLQKLESQSGHFGSRSNSALVFVRSLATRFPYAQTNDMVRQYNAVEEKCKC